MRDSGHPICCCFLCSLYCNMEFNLLPDHFILLDNTSSTATFNRPSREFSLYLWSENRREDGGWGTVGALLSIAVVKT
jgi:hypothetical protein